MEFKSFAIGAKRMPWFTASEFPIICCVKSCAVERKVFHHVLSLLTQVVGRPVDGNFLRRLGRVVEIMRARNTNDAAPL